MGISINGSVGAHGKNGKAGKAEGLYWGGDWRSFKDWAHLQFFPNYKLSDVKKESGLA